MIVPFWKSAFPKLLSYNRFIEIMPRCLQALSSFFHQVKGKDTGISIIDSTKLVVCHNLRIKRHRVFKGLAVVEKVVRVGFMVLNYISLSII